MVNIRTAPLYHGLYKDVELGIPIIYVLDIRVLLKWRQEELLHYWELMITIRKRHSGRFTYVNWNLFDILRYANGNIDIYQEGELSYLLL